MVALGRRLQQLVSLGAGEVSWLKDNSVHWRRRWTLNAPVTKSTPENQPTSSLAVLGPVCLRHHPQQSKCVPANEGLSIPVPGSQDSLPSEAQCACLFLLVPSVSPSATVRGTGNRNAMGEARAPGATPAPSTQFLPGQAWATVAP